MNAPARPERPAAKQNPSGRASRFLTRSHPRRGWRCRTATQVRHCCRGCGPPALWPRPEGYLSGGELKRPPAEDGLVRGGTNTTNLLGPNALIHCQTIRPLTCSELQRIQAGANDSCVPHGSYMPLTTWLNALSNCVVNACWESAMTPSRQVRVVVLTCSQAYTRHYPSN